MTSLTGSVIMRITYGYELQRDDPYVTLAAHAIEGLTETFGLGFLVDMFPIRKVFSWLFCIWALKTTSVKYVPDWMPGAGWKRKAKLWRTSTMEILELPWTTLMDKYVGILIIFELLVIDK